MRMGTRSLLATVLLCALLWAALSAWSPLSAQATPPPGSGTTAAPSSAPPAGFIGAIFALYFVFIMFVVLIGLGGLVASCLAIYDCARRDFPDPNTRAMWCLLIMLLRLIGSVVYYFVVYRKGDPPIQRLRLVGEPPPSPMSAGGG